MNKSFCSSTYSTAFDVISSLNLGHFNRCVLICNSLQHMMLSIFLYAYFPYIYLLFEVSIQTFVLLFNWLFVFLLLSFKMAVYFEYQWFIIYVFCNYFLTFCGLFFHSLNTISHRVGLVFMFFFNFNEIQFIFISHGS